MFERKHIILALVLSGITLMFGAHFVQTANHEFIIYVGIIIAAFCLIAATFPKVRYPYSCLLGLAIWAVMHLAGGGTRIGNDILYAYIVLPISIHYQVLRYDQIVHAWGFGVCTLIMLHLLTRIAPQANLRRFSVGFLVITAGMGLGALNENIEFLLVVLLPQTGVGGYINTSLDLCANFVGAVLAYFLFCIGAVRLDTQNHS